MSADRTRLAAMVDEANRLQSAREGVHDMCAACAIIRGLAAAYEDLRDVPWERLERLLAKMRIGARTGFYPKDVPTAA